MMFPQDRRQIYISKQHSPLCRSMQPVKVPGNLCISCETGQSLHIQQDWSGTYGQLQS